MTERKVGSVYIVETEPAPKQTDRLGLKCSHPDCQRRSVDTELGVGWRTSEGWEVDWPTCGHGKFVTCPDHKAPDGCPQCGWGEFFT